METPSMIEKVGSRKQIFQQKFTDWLTSAIPDNSSYTHLISEFADL